MTLAERLKDWRKRAGLTQAKAAEVLQIPATTLTGIEQGRPFRYEHLLLLALQTIEAKEHV